MQKYRVDKTWEWNLRHAPEARPAAALDPVPGEWNWCGIPVRSPLGISAGPLLNSGWILQYASAGFDILVYKTVRTSQRACYKLPNLVPVHVTSLESAGAVVPRTTEMAGSWAVSFGMPSVPPEDWQQDVQLTRSMLAEDQLLVVSVVATADTSLSGDAALHQLADDFASCARAAVLSGAHGIEANFSCPNVDTADGQLYQHTDAAGFVAERIRGEIGDAPLVLKIGRVQTEDLAERLLLATVPWVNGLAMTNSISAHVQEDGGDLLFDGQQRGICGDATRDTSISQVKLFSELCEALVANGRIAQHQRPQLIGVGGISAAEHVESYLRAGADSVAMATAAMTNPEIGISLRAALTAARQ